MFRFFLLGVALCAALIAPSALPGLFTPVDHALNDWRVRFSVQPHVESRIVIVDVDELSLAEQGAWPWPRETLARLIQTLIDDYKVAGIAVDMVFPEQRPNDRRLAEQLRRPEVTGAVVFDLEQRNLAALKFVLPPTLPVQIEEGAPQVPGVPVVTNHASLMPSRVGHITPIFDSDGAVRRLPPLVCSAGTSCRPSLALAAYAGMVGHARLDLRRGQGLLSAPWELSLQTDDGAPIVTLPLSDDGSLVVPYRHSRQDWTSVSAVDVLKRTPDPAVLKGVIVLLGGTALGLSDVIATPLGPVAAGLEPHVEILSALLDNDFPVAPRHGTLLAGALLLPFALLLGCLIRRYDKPLHRAAVFPAWLLATWAGGAIGAMAALQSAGILLPLSPLLVFPPLAVLLILSTELYRTGRDRAGIFAHLSAYLPRPVADRLTSFGQVNTSVDASRREITVLFADIHGFAGLSESTTPEVVARLMQRVFTEMAEAVVRHHGTIDKFIGDAIMAFWNAPEDDPLHASRALAAAHEIQARMTALAPFCEELGLLPIKVGIGLETGLALVGNFGSAHRRTFTALGEPVILASRLEGLTNMYKEQILVGQSCANALGQKDLRALGTVQIRGRIQPVTIYCADS
ncbi:CHASE2 domain-containing protein [Noviherbaspirillum saxi]|uniref:Adenylate/guanylate cyclase domain-containing protein n=1 Tax=Noviherbaspirillum saxi TaxID=2320863 RepID=A0A3A3FUL4_9BURK|nr:adenylate/guanylate cyclase domain-containing protein [Noviherbaspirillum saxi]RJF99493.1 adenylate/guanylate cyclase domain-containing protein [Noviherbaspirillum saxi]